MHVFNPLSLDDLGEVSSVLHTIIRRYRQDRLQPPLQKCHHQGMGLWELADLCTPWCIHVVVTLQVAKNIADGNTGIIQLASACAADPESLQRVLRHLIAKGLFEEPSPGNFALNDESKALLDPMFQLGFDLDGIGGRMAYSWGTLLSAVRCGKSAYHEYFGQPFWEDVAAHPKVAESFDTLMGPGHGTPDGQVLVDPSGWSSINTVVDVGGGTGFLLTEILRTHPEVNGILVDFPATVAKSAPVFEAAKVTDRVKTAGQSFFDPLPPGADLYLLKSVLSDWPDPEASAILKRCAEAARPNGRVVLVNGVSPENEPSPQLLMMVLVGGKDRTLDEFSKLAADSGLTISSSGRQPSGRFIVECKPT